jgi:hypothetical protein
MCSILSSTRPPNVLRESGSKIVAGTRNTGDTSGVYSRMKRDSASLLAVTLRTGLMVIAALILILILLPAVLAAQAAVLR